jgi:hydroxypyruvate isomerase
MPRFAANLTMMFTEVPFLDRFAAARRAGFTAVEFQRPYAWPVDEVTRAARDAKVDCVLINAPSGNWDAGERGLAALPGREHEFREGLNLALVYAEALGVQRIHVTAGIASGPHAETVYLENLRWAAQRVLQKLVLIEPISQHAFPGYFLHTQAQAAAVCEQVNVPNLAIQFDCFHVQLTEGNLTQRLRDAYPRLGHVQIASVPDRHEPDEGEIRYEYIFELLDRMNYTGYVGCEYTPRGNTEAGLDWFRPWRAT